MMPLQPQVPPPAGMVQRIERAFSRLHRLLCLIERNAPPSKIERAERSYRRSLRELDVSEHELVRHYPKYRFAVLARQAADEGIPRVVELLSAELN